MQLNKDQVAIAKYRLALTFKGKVDDEILDDYQTRYDLKSFQFDYDYEKKFIAVYTDN